MNTIMIGLDVAKNVLQVHGVDAAGSVTVRRKLRRAQVKEFFAALPACVVGLEACGGAHHWGRMLQELGHEVRMMPAHYVKPYVKRNKTDGRDAEAICEAMGRPTMRFVAVKSEAAQATLALHRTRALLVRQRTMTGNALRSGLAEFGIVAAQGYKGLATLLQSIAADPCPLAAEAGVALSILAVQWQQLDRAVRDLDLRIVRLAREQEATRRLMEIPCVGPIGASAVMAKVADVNVFHSGRDFAAWIGLTPRQYGTGGQERSGGISKQGDRSLRQLLVLGATARLARVRAGTCQDPWLSGLLARRPFKVVAVALAAKTARIIWAVLKSGEHYRANHRDPLAGATA